VSAEPASSGATRETPYTMTARSVVVGLRCGDCVRIYLYLDLRQGTRVARAVRGCQEVADHLGWTLRTAKKHLRHLADAGLIVLDPEPRGAWGNTVVRIVHQPARARYARPAELPGVWEPEPPKRWRPPPSDAAELARLRADAERDAPRVEHPDAKRAAPPAAEPEVARRAMRGGATRPEQQPDAERVAPSVPGSLRSEGSVSERVAVGEQAGSSLSTELEDDVAAFMSTLDEDAEAAAVARLLDAFPDSVVLTTPSSVAAAPRTCTACSEPADRLDGAGTPWCSACEPF
jgi:hypothetical protein